MSVEVAEIRTIVERLDHELLGNGQPGRIAIIERDISVLQEWHAMVAGAIKILGLVFGILVSVGGVVLAAKLKSN